MPALQRVQLFATIRAATGSSMATKTADSRESAFTFIHHLGFIANGRALKDLTNARLVSQTFDRNKGVA